MDQYAMDHLFLSKKHEETGRAVAQLDDMLHSANDETNVIWDEDLQHTYNSKCLLQQLSLGIEDQIQCKEVIFTAPVLCEGDVQVFDEMPSVVVWDDDKIVYQNGESHVVKNNMLMVKAPMDELILDTSVPTLLELGIASVDVIYDEMPQLDMGWDVGLLHNFNSQDALVQHEPQFDECLVVDDDITVDLVIKDLLTHDSDTFLTEFDMGSANTLSNNLPVGVVWDEEIEHGQSSYGLLQHIALSADYLVGEKPNAEPHTYNVLTHVSGSLCLLELGIEAMHQSAEIHLEDNHAIVPECVEFMDQVTFSGDAQEAFASIHSDREASLTDEGAFYSCKVSECAAAEVSNKMTLPDVVWDHEPQHGPKSHGLLLQLASGEECSVGLDTKLIAELDTLKLAGSRESIDGEKAKGVIEGDTDKVLTRIGGLSHFLDICETSNVDETGELVVAILTHESSLLQYIQIDMSSADHGLENALQLDDQLSCEMLYGCNGNLQLEEIYVACLGRMPPSAGFVTDQFSPKYLNHQFQSDLCLSFYGAWVGQETESDCKDCYLLWKARNMW